MQSSVWQQQLSNLIKDPKELLELLQLDLGLLPMAEQAAKKFPLRVSRNFVAKMQVGNLQDPLLKQVLPLEAELDFIAGFTADPLLEKQANVIPGLLHKYQGRVLLITTGVCGINCRFCFRREFAYEDNNPGTAGWDKALEYIAADSSIEEVILSGGDPLVATDAQLAKLSQKIANINHIKTLRIHTRMPIIIPERITDEFINWFTNSRLKPVLVLHCNHAQEIDSELISAMKKLNNSGVILLNQAVLLRGINDSVSVLKELSKKLFSMGVLPYYLHLLDKVQGTAHFEVGETTAVGLINQLALGLPGYLVPKLVREEGGLGSKKRLI